MPLEKLNMNLIYKLLFNVDYFIRQFFKFKKKRKKKTHTTLFL